jgi:hypothetical protein
MVMKRIIYAISIVIISIFCYSCNDWFDVSASSDVRSSAHYATVSGFQQTLTGCYVRLAEPALYGKNLSWYAPEILAHQFEETTDILGVNLYAHNYKETQVTRMFETIWGNAYNVIVNANDALSKIDGKKEQMDPIDYAVIKGELLGIRGLLHFDLYRLFGHGNWKARGNELSARKTIPYVTTVSKQLTPQSTGMELYKAIVNDLEQAASLLKDYDPVTARHPASFYAEVNFDKYYLYRDLHLNYYTIKALLARVHLYFNTAEGLNKAVSEAEEVIDFVEKGGWSSTTFNTTIKSMNPADITSATASMAWEALTSINVNDLDRLTESYIKPNYQGSHALAMFILPDRINDIFEGISTDVRFSKLMSQNVSSDQQGYVPLKLYQSEQGDGFSKRVNIIRIQELYYILAEAKSLLGDKEEAIKIINASRNRRGISSDLPLDLSEDGIQKEIEKEYIKEFMSEGVMFFYYKRLGIERIPRMTSEEENLSDKEYVIPYPEYELQSGRKQ